MPEQNFALPLKSCKIPASHQPHTFIWCYERYGFLPGFDNDFESPTKWTTPPQSKGLLKTNHTCRYAPHRRGTNPNPDNPKNMVVGMWSCNTLLRIVNTIIIWIKNMNQISMKKPEKLLINNCPKTCFSSRCIWKNDYICPFVQQKHMLLIMKGKD